MTSENERYSKGDVVFYRVIYGTLMSFIIAITYGYISGDIYTENQTVTSSLMCIMLIIVLLYLLLELFAWYYREHGMSTIKRILRISFFLLIGNTDKANAE